MDNTQAIGALQSWREYAATQDPQAKQLKDSHLRLIVKSGVQTVDELQQRFPPIVGRFAQQIVDVLDGLDTDGVRGAHAASHEAEEDISPFAVPSRRSQPEQPQPSHTPTPVSPTTDTADKVDPEGFARYDYSMMAEEVSSCDYRELPAGGHQLRWKPLVSDAACVIYRVISADEAQPFSPDQSRVISVTIGTRAIDDAPFEHATRYYQVWANEGADVEDAKLEQPRLVYETAVVAPVQNVDLREDEGRVIGQWDVLPGTTNVQVFRVPVELSRMGMGNPQFRINADDTNLGGFVDAAAERGKHYIYQVLAEASVVQMQQGQQNQVNLLSSPFIKDLTISVQHEQVLDLEFALKDGETPSFDLRWTPPRGGRVLVYRTMEPPAPGLDRQPREMGALEASSFSADDRLGHPVIIEDDHALMRDVPWPRDWTRAYFTAVVLIGDKGFVGNTVRGVRVGTARDLKIVERVEQQIVSFTWPKGADTVYGFRCSENTTDEQALQGAPLFEISSNDYRQYGGYWFNPGQLAAERCDIVLVPSAFDGGRRAYGQPTRTTYRGLTLLRYQIEQTVVRREPVLRLQVTSPSPIRARIQFALIYRPDRLPLSITDGTALKVMPDVEGGGQPSALLTYQQVSPQAVPGMGWRTCGGDFDPSRGFVRLFLRLQKEALQTVALLDPPVYGLRLTPKQSWLSFGGKE
ncbi:hypothetical protein F8O06_09700 [Pseudoclavibacter sp. CFCC 14310]|uniref:hypothetical protein n=1 Tax=Pseudoclavibacter sp. CFCC 14310 TaxID=2615180 RepID=UPI001301495A|nr:hypothetical protein [Pseudoclavibacter sp. CFCC 14310]KAB1644318.1 hypothetical protein F8O06_09700 [Pseudoclavibacter sp. CFCC 14310]